ncbi:unnamed protein product, partial [Iphiclides podalirius]
MSRLGNNEGTQSPDKNIPIQQPVTNKRYTLVHKNGAIEYYDDLEAILRTYPHIKLPLNIQQANEIKATTIKTTDDFQSGDYHTNSLVQPIAWITTNDTNFWSKLLDDGANSFLYIFNIQSHPRVEKDTKTIIHANGTIVEEITETTWENDDDTPIITKSFKVTPAAEITN